MERILINLSFCKNNITILNEKNAEWLLIFIIDKYIFCSHIGQVLNVSKPGKWINRFQ
jgi:hypothetical protein